MKILLTGAFGNLGASTLEGLLSKRSHEILCFDIKTPRNEKEMARLSGLGSFNTKWGDISDPDVIAEMVDGRDVILHLAAIIPPPSEVMPDLVKKVNVEGTRNLVNAADKMENKPKFIFASSVSIHGSMQGSPPPRKADDPVEATDNYTHSKIEAEKIIKESGLAWTILRIGAAMPLDLMDRELKSSMSQLFDIPYDQRIESVHPRDVAAAFVNSADADAAGKVLYLGGGKSCQMRYSEFVKRMLGAIGIGMPPETAFRKPKDDKDYFYTDYMDTDEAQRLLNYQNNSFEDFLAEMKRDFGWKGFFTRPLSPLIVRFLMMYSFHGKNQ